MYDIVHVCMTCIVKYSLELTGTCDRQGCRQPVLTLCLSLSLLPENMHSALKFLKRMDGGGASSVSEASERGDAPPGHPFAQAILRPEQTRAR